MTHLKYFGVENFRVFKEKTEFEFAPITVLTGTNSSGKSSLVRAIQLLSKYGEFQKNLSGNNYQEFMDIEDLLLNDLLGDFSKVLNRSSDSKIISFSLPIVLKGIPDNMKLILNFSLEEGQQKQGKLMGISIYSNKDRSTIFSIEEKSYLEYELSINYLFFLNEYKRESEAIKTYRKNSTYEYEVYYKGLEDRESLTENDIDLVKETFKKLSQIHPYYHNYLYKLESINKENYRPFFDTIFGGAKVYYSMQEQLLEYTFEDQSLANIDLQKDEKELLRSFRCTVKFYKEQSGIEGWLDNPLMIEEIRRQRRKEKGQSISIFDVLRPLNSNLLSKLGRRHLNFKEYGYTINFSEETLKDNYILDLQERGLLFVVTPDNEDGEGQTMSEFFFEEFVQKNIIGSLFDAFEKFQNCFFISTFRNPVERIYRANISGEFAVLLKQVITKKILDNDNECKKFIDRYLKKFEIGESIEITREIEGQGTYVYIKRRNEEQPILVADVGYGVSQVLPLLLSIALVAYNNENEIPKLFIEEPETNLHPALQSKLADMFVDAAEKFNIQFVIETHSEYLIRKLQYLIANKNVKSEFVKLYYFYRPDQIPSGEDQVKEINIQEDGSLDNNFGSGFFDEATNLKFELLKLTNSQRN